MKGSEKFTLEELIELYQWRVNKLDEGRYPFFLSTDFGDEFPWGMSCYDIGDLLEKTPGLITKGMMTDHEHSCCYFNFKTRKSADSFCKRLAKFLKKRSAQESKLGRKF